MARVLSFTDRGIYCAAGDFYIDPWRPVARALITHGHADHARRGHESYLCTASAAPVMRHRLGKITLETMDYGETRQIGTARVSFHPAGHVPGSAQIRVEVGGEVWVVSGDYKVEHDAVSEPFEPVKCHVFISECTFGLPVFQWHPQAQVAAQINAWWASNAAQGRPSLLSAYALGKAQRLLSMVNPDIGPILTSAPVEATNRILRDQGWNLPKTMELTQATPDDLTTSALILATPSALSGPVRTRLEGAATAFASGWMRLSQRRLQRGLATGFVLSDHADWPGLNTAIRETGAEEVFVTHGYVKPFRRWLETQGYKAGIVETDYQGEEDDAPDALIAPPQGELLS